jgi:LCP family protein required for cell wall assembly
MQLPVSGNRSSRTTRRRVRGALIVALVAVVTLPVVLFGFGWWQFSQIPTVNVSAVLSSRNGRSGMNYLIVGTDSRAGIDASDPNAGAFLSGEVSGSRTDTIMILHINGSTTQLASVPRDLWVTDPANGEKGRINSTFAAGPANLISAVKSLGIPVDQYLEINFVSFDKLVDAVGGITLDIPAPAKDDHSGLSLPEAGPNKLDGSQALAYVRSRYYEEFINGRWRIDGTADIGRTERQRAFLSSLLHEMSNERNPFRLVTIPGSVGAGMRRGSTFSYLDAIGLAWTLKDAELQPVALPVTPRRTSGGADILELQASSSTIISELAS